MCDSSQVEMSRGNVTLVYRNSGGNSQEVMVMPPEYRHVSVIGNLYKRDLFIGRDGSIVSEGDLVYDVVEQKVRRLDYCTGSHELHFHDGGRSIAPVFLTHDDDYVFAYDLLLLEGTSCRRTRVGPVARLLGHLLLELRLRKNRKRRRLSGDTLPDDAQYVFLSDAGDAPAQFQGPNS